MGHDSGQSDLPVLREMALDLPTLLTTSKPRAASAKTRVYPDWINYASQRHIRDLARSSLTGELWLATPGGVLHWHADLKTYTRYTSEHGLAGNNTRAVTVDTSGRIWATHEHGGLSYFDGISWQPYTQLASARIRCLISDSRGGIWLASEDMIYSIPSPEHSPAVELSFPGTPIHMLTVNEDGNIWLCNARGIYSHQNGAWTLVFSQIGILTLAYREQQLWLGTLDGLILIDTATYTIHRNNAWPRGEVTALVATEDGAWSAINGSVGLATEHTWLPLCREQHLHTRVIALAAVHEEEIWLGTHYGLLHGTPSGYRFHLTESPPDVIGMTHFDTQLPAKASSNLIQSLALSTWQGETLVWMGTPNGLYSMQPANGQWQRHEQSGLRDIRAITSDGKQLWVASWHSGLYAIKDRPILALAAEEHGSFLTVAPDASSSYWAASLKGLYSYGENASWKCVVGEEALPRGGWIRTICQDTPTSVWLGTTEGLFHYHPVTQALLPSSDLLGKADIRALLTFEYDHTTLLWAGTAHGLYYGAPHRLQPLQAMSNYRITRLLYDGDAIWVGTERGLFCMTHDNAQAWTITNTLTSRNSGLAADHITALALSKDEQGHKQLWIGSSCGLSCYSY